MFTMMTMTPPPSFSSSTSINLAQPPLHIHFTERSIFSPNKQMLAFFFFRSLRLQDIYKR